MPPRFLGCEFTVEHVEFSNMLQVILMIICENITEHDAKITVLSDVKDTEFQSSSWS